MKTIVSKVTEFTNNGTEKVSITFTQKIKETFSNGSLKSEKDLKAVHVFTNSEDGLEVFGGILPNEGDEIDESISGYCFFYEKEQELKLSDILNTFESDEEANEAFASLKGYFSSGEGSWKVSKSGKFVKRFVDFEKESKKAINKLVEGNMVEIEVEDLVKA